MKIIYMKNNYIDLAENMVNLLNSPTHRCHVMVVVVMRYVSVWRRFRNSTEINQIALSMLRSSTTHPDSVKGSKQHFVLSKAYYCLLMQYALV